MPLTREGVEAGAILAKDGARICMTACYNQQQAFLSAGLGVEYVAPYLGRMSGGWWVRGGGCVGGASGGG